MGGRGIANTGEWNAWGMNPATRTVQNGKGYDRNKLKDAERKNSRKDYNNQPAVLFLPIT